MSVEIIPVLSKVTCRPGKNTSLIDLLKAETTNIVHSDKGKKIEFVEITKEQLEKNKLPKEVEQARIMVADPPLLAPYLSDHFPKLEWIQSTFAGVNAIVTTSTRQDFKLTRMDGFGRSMSEYVLGAILMRERHFVTYYQCQQNSHWESNIVGFRSLSSLTIGIMGATGNIGKVISKDCKHFGMTVHGLMRTIRSDMDEFIDKQFTSLDEFLSECDYVVNVLPSTRDTSGLLNGEALKSCERSPVFINVGRWDIINEQNILNALNQKWISHAVIDVHPQVPLPSTSLLWKREDVTITPYVAALPYAEDVTCRTALNLKFFLEGKPLELEVNWKDGY